MIKWTEEELREMAAFDAEIDAEPDEDIECPLEPEEIKKKKQRDATYDWIRRNRARVNEKHRQWVDRHRQDINQRQREYYRKNREKEIERVKNYQRSKKDEEGN